MQAIETPAKISFSPLAGHYTLEQFWALPEPQDRCHYDLIGGYLFMVPPPEQQHDEIDWRLKRSLIQFLIESQVPGEVLHPRAAIYHIEANTHVEPDMMYVSPELKSLMGNERTSADIVFEYLSPSTAVYDRTTKADTYLYLGVRELWLLDPLTFTIEVRNVVAGESGLAWRIRRYAQGEWPESEVLNGWRVSVDEILLKDER